MKSRTSKILLAVVILASMFFVFSLWYKVTYSMQIATGQEINSPTANYSLLIATQSSAYKDALLQKIVAHFESDVYIKVMDISQLDTLNENHWDALCIMHTWEMGQPPKVIQRYLKKKPTLRKTVFFNTAGDGESHLPDVDAISGASDLTNIPDFSARIIQRVAAILQRNDLEAQFISIK